MKTKNLIKILGTAAGIFFISQGILGKNIVPVDDIAAMLTADLLIMPLVFIPLVFLGGMAVVFLSYWYTASKRGIHLSVMRFVFATATSFPRQIFIIAFSTMGSVLFADVFGYAMRASFFVGFYIIFSSLGLLGLFDFSKDQEKLLKQMKRTFATKPLQETVQLQKIEIPATSFKEKQVKGAIAFLIVGAVFLIAGIFVFAQDLIIGAVFILLGSLAVIGFILNVLRKAVNSITMTPKEIMINFQNAEVLTFETPAVSRIELIDTEGFQSKGNCMISFYLKGKLLPKQFDLLNKYEEVKKIISDSAFFKGEEGFYTEASNRTIFLPQTNDESESK